MQAGTHVVHEGAYLPERTTSLDPEIKNNPELTPGCFAVIKSNLDTGNETVDEMQSGACGDGFGFVTASLHIVRSFFKSIT